jgi:hypothetical protein
MRTSVVYIIYVNTEDARMPAKKAKGSIISHTCWKDP